MFKAYGSEQVVIVNPVNDKKRLFVRPRDWSVERQERQIKRIAKVCKNSSDGADLSKPISL